MTGHSNGAAAALRHPIRTTPLSTRAVFRGDEPTRRPTSAHGPFATIAGESAEIAAAVRLAAKIALGAASSALITGEAGTGKELLARCIHNAGDASGSPFVPVSCVAIPEPLLEAELFGFQTDAGISRQGILEMAGSGTVFLEDIAELPPSLQGPLARVMETGFVRRRGAVAEVPVACRIIASSKVSLEDRRAAGTFDDALYQRLTLMRIDLTPVRERGEDIYVLADHLLGEIARVRSDERKHLAIDALQVLKGHRWPGNVRELKHVLERAAILCESGLISAEHLLVQQRRSIGPVQGKGEFLEIRIPSTGGKRLRDIEREALEITLQLTNFNQSAAARILGISRPTLARKLRAFGLGREMAVA